MVKRILGVIAGLLVFVAVATVAGVIMRLTWPAYSRVASAMLFTLPMLITRLSIGAVATLAAGLVTAAVTRGSAGATLAIGVLLLLVFVPEHIVIWPKFPVWYHLTFLVSLIPLTYLGGTALYKRRERRF
jgi:predicted benzoate:H+ symporter BenE